MNIAVLGGRFDPPHIGHYLIAKQVLESGPDIDKVLLIPASEHQWKPINASGEDRVHMLQAFAEEGIEVSAIELVRGGVSYTIETIKKLKKETGGNIFWVVGSDIVSEFYKWERADELLQEAKFFVFPRDPYHLPESLPKGFQLFDHKGLITINLSSTVIRERVKNKKSIKGFVFEDVEKYIREKKLYLS
jgi:nicotinate-nucleotide adenylyltransferase